MKRTKSMKKTYSLMIGILAILIISPAIQAQEKENEMKLKIVREKDGETTTIDTTISISGLNNLKEMDVLKDILENADLKEFDLDIDLEDLDGLDVKVLDLDEKHGKQEKIMIMKHKGGEGEDGKKEAYNVTIVHSDSAFKGETVKVHVSESSHGYFISDGDEKVHEITTEGGAQKVFIHKSKDGENARVIVGHGNAVWFDDNDPQVEVVETEDGKKVKVKSKDGSVREYDLEEGKGTYVIGEDGEMTTVESDMVWTDESEGKKVFRVKVDDHETVIVESDGEVLDLDDLDKKHNVFVYSSEAEGEEVEMILEILSKENGEGMSFMKKIILKPLNEEDFEALHKSGADIGDRDSESLSVEGLKFHPNPSDGKFTLEFTTPEGGSTEIMIYDVNGKQVYTEKIKNFDGHYEKAIDISAEDSGTYFLKIKQGDRISTKKIILD